MKPFNHFSITISKKKQNSALKLIAEESYHVSAKLNDIYANIKDFFPRHKRTYM